MLRLRISARIRRIRRRKTSTTFAAVLADRISNTGGMAVSVEDPIGLASMDDTVKGAVCRSKC